MTVWCTRAPQAFGRHYRPAARFGIRKHRDRPLRPDRLITQQARFRIGSPSVLRRIRAPHYASTNPTSFSPIKYPDKYSAKLRRGNGGVSYRALRQHWRNHVSASGGSTDPAFAQRAADIVALYLQPPQPQPRPAPISPVILACCGFSGFSGLPPATRRDLSVTQICQDKSGAVTATNPLNPLNPH